jgi:hypothetical protein
LTPKNSTEEPLADRISFDRIYPFDNGQAGLRRHPHLHSRIRRPRSLPGRMEPTDDTADGLARELAAHTTSEQFAAGLHYLLDGIARHAHRDTPPGR